jgi:hypothetical protein
LPNDSGEEAGLNGVGRFTWAYGQEKRPTAGNEAAQNCPEFGADRPPPHPRHRPLHVPLDPEDQDIGRGDWRLVARMRCESGEDGSTFFVGASTRSTIN